MVLLRVEQVLCQLRFAAVMSEVLWRHNRRPKARAPTDGTVVAIGRLCEVQVGIEGDCAAMTTGAICFQHEQVSTLMGRGSKSFVSAVWLYGFRWAICAGLGLGLSMNDLVKKLKLCFDILAANCQFGLRLVCGN